MPLFPSAQGSDPTLYGYPVLTTSALLTTDVILLDQRQVLLATEGGPTVDVSREASVQADSAPATPPTPMISLWQQNMIGLRCEQFIYWMRARDQGVVLITGVDWGTVPPALMAAGGPGDNTAQRARRSRTWARRVSPQHVKPRNRVADSGYGVLRTVAPGARFYRAPGARASGPRARLVGTEPVATAHERVTCTNHFPARGRRNITCGGGDPLSFSAVWASVTMISQDIAKLRPTVYKSNDDGSKEPFPNHPAQRVLDHPNPYQTRVDFWQHFMMATLLQGNSYTLFDNDERGVISAMFPLDPYGTRPVIGEDGSVFYQLNRTRLEALESV